jgi:hypothetical protein
MYIYTYMPPLKPEIPGPPEVEVIIEIEMYDRVGWG